MIGKAFIPAAGLGSRLGEMTKNMPKALIEVGGTPMLEMTITRLKQQGVNHFMVNVHHFAEQVTGFIKKKKYFKTNVEISDESKQLLDTGGAIRRAREFFKGDDPILIHNVDVISQVDLNSLANYHQKQKALATLVVRKRDSGRALLFGDDMKLVGWANLEKGEFKWVHKPIKSFQGYAYSGIYIVDPGFASKLPFRGKFSIIDAWLEMAKSETIIGYHDKSPVWFDLGTPEKIEKAEKRLP